MLKTTRSKLVRVNVWWSGPGISVAKRRPKRPADPADPAYDWTTYDRTVQVRGRQRHATRVLDHRHAAVGERCPRLERRAHQCGRPEGVRDRGGDAVLRHLRRARTATYSRASRAGSPGTSRTIRCSCARSTCARAATWVIQSAKDYARICNAVVAGVRVGTRRQGGVRGNRRRAATTTRTAAVPPCRRSRFCAP